MNTEDIYGDYCRDTKSKGGWGMAMAVQENFCARLSALHTEKALKSNYLWPKARAEKDISMDTWLKWQGTNKD